MKTRITGTIAILIISASAFFCADLSVEAILDTCELDERYVPKIIFLLDMITPIHAFFYIFFPFGISLNYWLFSKGKKEDISSIIWYCLFLFYAILFLSICVMVTPHFILLNDSREITNLRIISNILLSIIIVLGIILKIKTNKKNPE